MQLARECPSPSRDRDAAHDDGGDDLEFQPKAGVGVDVGETNGVEQGGPSRQGAHDDEHGENDAARADARQPRGLGVRTGGVDSPSAARCRANPQANGAKTASAIDTTSH